MAVVIKIDKNYIPVKIGSLEFKFHLDDDYILKLEEYAKELKNIEDVESVKDVELFKQAFDNLLGAGAGESIYEETGRSTFIMIDVFFQVLKEVIFEVMAKRGKDMTKLSDEAKDKMFNEFMVEAIKKGQAEEDK
jgi:hypothetical protein